MLVLLLRIGDQRFGLDAADVLEVVPCVPLHRVPGAPAWIAGWLRHRDAIIPVVDLAHLSGSKPCAPFLSTRIIVLRQQTEAGRGEPVGLLAEGVTRTTRVDATRLTALGVSTPDAPWLGPVALDDGELVQLVRWNDLVPAEVRAALRAEVEA